MFLSQQIYFRNTLLSATVHAGLIALLFLFSVSSCRRHASREIVTFVDFQASLPGGLQGGETAGSSAEDMPEAIPEPGRSKPAVKKSNEIEVSKKLVKRPAAVTSRKQMSADEIRKLLGEAVSVSGRGTGGGGGVGGMGVSPYGWYYSIVRSTMYDAWQQPGSLSRSVGLVSRVEIRVQKDGVISRRKMIQGSGNQMMDESVMKAVESVPRLPELPDGLGTFYKDIAIDFELTEMMP